MAFCSYIFLKIAASFSMVALVDSPVHLLLKVFEKRPYRSWAYLWGTFSLPWGLFSLPVRIGYLFLSLVPTHPRKVPGIHEVFCFPEFPLHWKLLFYRLCWTLLSFCWKKKKEQLIQKLLTHLIRTKYNQIRSSKSFCWIRFIKWMVTPQNFIQRLRKIDISPPVGGAIFTGSLWPVTCIGWIIQLSSVWEWVIKGPLGKGSKMLVRETWKGETSISTVLRWVQTTDQTIMNPTVLSQSK